jgi:hypothetical protein
MPILVDMAWTVVEDHTLMTAVYESKSQRAGVQLASERLRHRTLDSCRSRWQRLLRQPSLPTTENELELLISKRWLPSEMRLLREGLRTHGRNYAQIGATLLPHRPVVQIRARANRLFAYWRAQGCGDRVPPVQRNVRRRVV